jgi:hypothetical protein
MASNPVIEAFPALASAPATPMQGFAYVNTTDHKVYVYYTGQWQVLHELSAVLPEPVTGNPIGLLLSLTYS